MLVLQLFNTNWIKDIEENKYITNNAKHITKTRTVETYLHKQLSFC